MPNMQNIIKQQNERLLRADDDENLSLCNCTDKAQCPLNGACLTPSLIYTAEVKYTEQGDDQKNIYHGSTGGPFKTRYNGHQSSFRLEHKEKDTELSKLIWKLKRKGIAYTITWSIAKRAQPYKCGSRRCDLCLSEKVIIGRSRNPCMLNKRTELLAKCRHRNKFLLSSIKN